MRYLLVISLLLLNITGFAQKGGKESIIKAVAAFDNALVNKDSVALKELLDDQLNYGHSNGWIQTKKDVIADLFNGKLEYKRISAKDTEVRTQGKTAAVRSYTEVDCVLDGKPLSIKLKVLQVWVKKKKHWELFARQSVKI